MVLLAALPLAQLAHAQSLYEMPAGVETRWASPENPKAERGLEPPIYSAGPGLRELDLKKLPKVNLFERTDDYSSCANFYLDRPENGLTLAPVTDRLRNLN